MDVFEQIAKGGATGATRAGIIELGVDTLPPLKADPGDRNRTSPFAFTGNRFEFRAPGSNQSISDPMVAINTILADSLDYISGELEELSASGDSLADAVQNVLQAIFVEHGDVVFNGDGYAQAWQEEEAVARGLKNLRTTVDAVVEYTSPEVVEVFERYGVLSARELEAREDVIFEYYALSLLVEAKENVEIATTMLMPAAIRYQGELASTAASLKAVGIPASMRPRRCWPTSASGSGVRRRHQGTVRRDRRHARGVRVRRVQVRARRSDPGDGRGPRADRRAETLVADDLWPLPTYIEMMTIL